MSTTYRGLIFLIGVMFLQSSAPAQNVEFDKKNFSKDDKKLFKEARAELKKGNDYYEVYRYSTALEHYKAAQAFNPDNAELNYKVGKCYLKTMTKVKGIPYLEKVLKLNPMVEPDIRYLLGQGYHLNYEFDRAIEEYKAYRSNPGVEADQVTATMAAVSKKIEECLMGKKLVAEPARVFIDNLKVINSPYPEYSPLISADESIMIFTSRRSNTTGGGKDEGSDFQYYEDVYISYQNDGQWSAPVNVGKPINTDVHDATVGLSPDGQSLFVYRYQMSDLGDIYQCALQGENWSKPKRLGKNINDNKAHESSACFSNDGRTMFFVSDKEEGGMGGRDIYRSTLDNPDAKVGSKKRWGSAFNLSTTLNTKYDEEGVFMHPDGKTLYFSSKGHETMGGYDIFKAVKDENGTWGKPMNLGYPINTPDDDVFFVMSASGKHGYYSSIKNDGMGEKDIYRVTFLGPEKPPVLNNEDNLLASLTNPVSETVIEEVIEIRTVALTILKGTVTDALSLQKLEAGIELIDNEKNKVIANFKSNAKTGKYLVSLPAGKNYGLAVKAKGYLFHSENFDIPKTAGYSEVIKDIALKKVAVGSKIVLKNIFFAFDKATLRDESTSELERLTKLLNDVPTLKIEISGHTDSKGADVYNQKLSERRAHAVVDYLVAAGIVKDRLTYKGVGEAEPVATNDTDEGRQENRRTEFKVIAK